MALCVSVWVCLCMCVCVCGSHSFNILWLISFLLRYFNAQCQKTANHTRLSAIKSNKHKSVSVSCMCVCVSVRVCVVYMLVVSWHFMSLLYWYVRSKKKFTAARGGELQWGTGAGTGPEAAAGVVSWSRQRFLICIKINKNTCLASRHASTPPTAASSTTFIIPFYRAQIFIAAPQASILNNVSFSLCLSPSLPWLCWFWRHFVGLLILCSWDKKMWEENAGKCWKIACR